MTSVRTSRQPPSPPSPPSTQDGTTNTRYSRSRPQQLDSAPWCGNPVTRPLTHNPLEHRNALSTGQLTGGGITLHDRTSDLTNVSESATTSVARGGWRHLQRRSAPAVPRGHAQSPPPSPASASCFGPMVAGSDTSGGDIFDVYIVASSWPLPTFFLKRMRLLPNQFDTWTQGSTHVTPGPPVPPSPVSPPVPAPPRTRDRRHAKRAVRPYLSWGGGVRC